MAYGNSGKNTPIGYKGTGVDADTAMSITDVGRFASNFVPGGKVAQGAVDAGLAAVQGDIEASKEQQRMEDAGMSLQSNSAKWNPRIRGHVEKLQNRWKSRAGEAVVTGAGTIAGGAAGVATMGAIGGSIGTFAIPIPIVGTTIGTAVGSIAGGALGGFATSKAYNVIAPRDEQDEVDLTLKIVDAQKQGQGVPPEVLFAQWAAQQHGTMDAKLKADLKARTGLTNFNDAVEQGKMAELGSMMRNIEYDNAMRGYMGILPDSKDPGRTTADQLAEWVNTGMVQGKDLLIGGAYIPNMSLDDAKVAGYTSDPLMAPTLEMNVRKNREMIDGVRM